MAATEAAPVRLVGTVTDMYGVAVSVGVDHGAVTIRAHGAVLDAAQRNEVIRLWCEAEFAAERWEAGQNARSMAGEVPGEV